MYPKSIDSKSEELFSSQICLCFLSIGTTIRRCQEIQCLPYAGFFFTHRYIYIYIYIVFSVTQLYSKTLLLFSVDYISDTNYFFFVFFSLCIYIYIFFFFFFFFFYFICPYIHIHWPNCLKRHKYFFLCQILALYFRINQI